MTEHTESPAPGGHDRHPLLSNSITSPNSPATAPQLSRPSVPSIKRVEEAIPGWKNLTSEPVTQPAVHWREILAIIAIVALADITIFRGTGFAGGAAFLVAMPVLLILGSPVPTLSAMGWCLGLMVWATAARLIWQGSVGTGVAGLLVLIAFAMTLTRRTPFILELLGFTLKSWIDGVDAFRAYDKWFRHHFRYMPPVFSMHWILPLIAVAVFGGIFVAANPDLAHNFHDYLTQLANRVTRWLETFPTSPFEAMFCLAVGWYVVGTLRPSDWSREWEAITSVPDVSEEAQTTTPTEVSTLTPYWNTLVAVSVLFAVYLVFEFQTLWFRQFPKGFHYSGYAHQGAAWLTVALALATVVLSFIFRGRLLKDPRLPAMRIWAWIWSVENFVLALAVYNRLWIYVGFNGMTRMRMVAFFGITSVVVGFLLVLWKIAHNRGFVWLIRRHLLTVTLAAYAYLVIPVDWIVYTYNVRRVLAGDPAPAVQITEHYVSPEGILTLFPLLNSSDPIIRNGIQSMLENQLLAEANNPNQRPGWTSYQLVHSRLSRELSKLPSPETTDAANRERSGRWDVFRQFVYQWY